MSTFASLIVTSMLQPLHKLYGPTGIGVLYGKYEHLAAMPPFNNGGGEMIREVFEDHITYGDPPHKFDAMP